MSYVLLLCLLPGIQDAMMAFDDDLEHLGLFITEQDVHRARAGRLALDFHATEAEKLLERARAVDVAALPSLDDSWWAENQDLPWSQTYPEINHYTGQVPREWTAALQNTMRAALLYPEEGLDAQARDILLGLSEYSFAYEHFDVGLNYTTWGRQVLEAYEVLQPGFTEAERAQIDAFFKRMLEAIQQNHEYWIEHEPGGALNNHYAWHCLAMIMYGLFYDEPELVEAGLHSPKGPLDSLQYGFRDNGLWLEASINYHFTATVPLVIMAELLENADYPFSLWDYETDDGHSLRQAYDAVYEAIFPDGTLPNIGDCYARRRHPGSSPDYEVLYRRFQDPVYAWLIHHSGGRHSQALFGGIPELPTGTAPRFESRNWPEQGYTMLRTATPETYFHGLGWTLFTTWSGAPVHDNRDKLSFMLFADNHHWLVDAEARAGVYHAFSSAIQRELNRHTVSHNTVMVDWQSQRHPGERLELLEYQILPNIQRVTTADRDSRLYPGVQQMRTFIVHDDYVLDVFQVAAEEARTLTWLLHVDGEHQDGATLDWAVQDPWKSGPQRWLMEPEDAPLAADAGYHEVFAHDGDMLTLDLRTTAGEGRLIRCAFPRTDEPDGPVYATRMLDLEDRKHAIFLALYRRGNHEPVQELSIAPDKLDRLMVTIDLGDGNDPKQHLVPELDVD